MKPHHQAKYIARGVFRPPQRTVMWAVEVAKVEQYGVLMDSEREVVVTVKWAHPAETPALLERLRGLACGSLTAVMEPTGVYGDTLRRQLREAGIEVHQMSAKRVHDACEVYDGVPSLHDAKAAQVLGRLYFEGASRVWVEASEQERSHDAMGRLYRLHKQHQHLPGIRPSCSAGGSGSNLARGVVRGHHDTFPFLDKAKIYHARSQSLFF